MTVSARHQTRLSLDSNGDYNSLKINEKWMTMIVSACQQTCLSLDGKGDFNSLENNETNDHDSLRVSTDSLVSRWQGGLQ